MNRIWKKKNFIQVFDEKKTIFSPFAELEQRKVSIQRIDLQRITNALRAKFEK